MISIEEPIRKIIKSSLPPKDETVIWLDISNIDKPLLKYYNFDTWTPLSTTDVEIGDLKSDVKQLEKEVETKFSGIKIYKVDEKELISEDTGDTTIIKVGKIPASKIDGLDKVIEEKAKGARGIRIISGDKEKVLSLGEDKNINIKLGDSLDYDESLNIVWK